MGKICSDCGQKFFEWVSKRGSGKELKEGNNKGSSDYSNKGNE